MNIKSFQIPVYDRTKLLEYVDLYNNDPETALGELKKHVRNNLTKILVYDESHILPIYIYVSTPEIVKLWYKNNEGHIIRKIILDSSADSGKIVVNNLLTDAYTGVYGLIRSDNTYVITDLTQKQPQLWSCDELQPKDIQKLIRKTNTGINFVQIKNMNGYELCQLLIELLTQQGRILQLK